METRTEIQSDIVIEGERAVVIPEEPEEKIAEPAEPFPSIQRYILTIFQGIRTGSRDSISYVLVNEVRQLLQEIVESRKELTEIDLWLHSGGGSGDAAFKLVLTLRAYCSRLRIIVPDYAKSAATLMVLGAEEIYMGASAELGPLDAQVEHPDREDERVSALSIAGALSNLAETGINLMLQTGVEIIDVAGMKRSNSLQHAIDFVIGLMQPIACKLDPAVIHSAQQELGVAKRYGDILLATRRLSEEEKAPENQIKLASLPEKLVTDYPSHGFVIWPEEAKRLGLMINPVAEYEWSSDLRENHDVFMRDHKTVINLIKKSPKETKGAGNGQVCE